MGLDRQSQNTLTKTRNQNDDGAVLDKYAAQCWAYEPIQVAMTPCKKSDANAEIKKASPVEQDKDEYQNAY